MATLEYLTQEFESAFAIVIDPSQSLDRRRSASRRVTNTSIRIAGLKNAGLTVEKLIDERGTLAPWSHR